MLRIMKKDDIIKSESHFFQKEENEMFDILIAVLSVCVFVWWTKITFKLAWGTAKILATVLAVSALVVLILCLVFAICFIVYLP